MPETDRDVDEKRLHLKPYLSIISLFSEEMPSEVSNSRVIETSYCSPQLTHWTLGPDEWVLFKQLPVYATRRKRKQVEVLQLPLPEMDEQEQVL